MDLYGWIQLALFLGLLLLVTRPMGVYLYRVQDPVQIHAHRPGDQQEKTQEKRKLYPSVEIHAEASFLEFLGSDDRDEQVPDQQDADDADDDIQHGFTSFPGSARTGRTARTSR